jgi:hypothetical protein
MPDFKINITTDASSAVAGSQQAAAGFEKTAERYEQALQKMAAAQAEAQGKIASPEDEALMAKAAQRKAENTEFSRLAKEANDELAGSVKNVTKEEVEAALKTDKLTSNKKDLKEVIKNLTRDYPPLRAAALLFLNPVTAAATLAAAAFAAIKSQIDQLNESLTTSQWEGYGEAVKARKADFEAAAMGAAAFARQMQTIRDATESAATASEKVTSVFRAQMSAQDKLDAARKALEVSQANGEKDPVRKARSLLEIEERYATRKLKRDEETSRFEINEQHRRLGNEVVTAMMAETAVKAAEKKAQSMKTESQVAKELENARQRLADIEAERNAKQTRLDALSGQTFLYGTQDRQRYVLYNQLQSLEQQKALQQGIVGKMETRGADQINAWRGNQEYIENMRGAGRNAMERANGIRAMLPTQERVAGIESEARLGEARLGSATRLTEAGNQAEGILQKQVEEVIKSRELDRAGAELLLKELQETRVFKAETQKQLREVLGRPGSI